MLTKAENEVLKISAKLFNKCVALPKLHPMINSEICKAIHDIQFRIMSRPQLRKERRYQKFRLNESNFVRPLTDK